MIYVSARGHQSAWGVWKTKSSSEKQRRFKAWNWGLSKSTSPTKLTGGDVIMEVQNIERPKIFKLIAEN